MNSIKMIAFALVALLVSISARADVLVLVHGYMGDAMSWESSGINAALAERGWPRAGILVGQRLIPARGSGQAANKSYAVELPSLAPLMLQADYLRSMLQRISSLHPDEPLIIAGHSAGGVVARVVLVRGGVTGVRGLITIAAPHLGTSRALQALDATSSSWPVSLVSNVLTNGLYDKVKSSRGALLDLVPAQPGSMLYWLNGQSHPEIEYHSIVRTGAVGMGDQLVPVFSQDMNNVYALRGRSKVRVVDSGHSLNVGDGVVLAEILETL